MSGSNGGSSETVGEIAFREPDASEPARVLFRLLTLTASVSSNDASIVQQAASLYSMATTPLGRHAAPLAPSFQVSSHQWGDGQPGYRVSEGGQQIEVLDSAPDAVAFLEQLINRAVVASSFGEYLLMHAGVVATGGRALLFPGPSGAGKSTLVAALCLAGFSYLSDELAALPGLVPAVLPFPKAICLKAGGWSALKGFCPVPVPLLTALRVDGEELYFIAPPRSCPPNVRMKVGYVVVPIRMPGSTARLVPCSRAVALSELARHSMNLPRYGASGVEVLARLVEKSECFQLTYGDLQGAVAAIVRITGHRPEQ